MQDAEIKALVKAAAAEAAAVQAKEIIEMLREATRLSMSANQRLDMLEAKVRGVLVGSMAAQMLPQVMAACSPVFETGPLTEDQALELAFRLADKIAARMEKALGVKA